MLWWPDPKSSGRLPPCVRMNECIETVPWDPSEDAVKGVLRARPSSYHPGGVIASFCDGHQEFMAETIDYNVWRHLMTPNGVRSGVIGTLNEDF